MDIRFFLFDLSKKLMDISTLKTAFWCRYGHKGYFTLNYKSAWIQFFKKPKIEKLDIRQF